MMIIKMTDDDNEHRNDNHPDVDKNCNINTVTNDSNVKLKGKDSCH